MKRNNIFIISLFLAILIIIPAIIGMGVFAKEPAIPNFEATTATTQLVETTIPEEELVVPPAIQFPEIEYVEYFDLESVKASYYDLEIYMIDFLLETSDMMISTELLENDPLWEIINARQIEYTRLCEIRDKYIADIDRMMAEEEARIEQAKWDARMEEYPIATQVWLYMKNEFGWNDVVCAGIMGNLMAECGGCWTDDLDWEINKSSGLGMVQWIGGRRKQIISIYGEHPTWEQQLIFMKDEMYGTNGVTKQITDWQLDKIMNAETPEECAFAFASYFERCSEQHRAPRRGYAKKAYEYFVG